MLSKKKLIFLEKISKRVRTEVVKMLSLSGSGHPGGSLSSADFLTNLYFSGLLKFNKKNFKSRDRDLVILSAGHYCPTLYAILAIKNFFQFETFKKFKKV